jgi:hypothetical protein
MNSKYWKKGVALGLGIATLGLFATLATAEEAADPYDVLVKACDSYKGQKSVQLKALVSQDQIVGEDSRKIQKNLVVNLKVQMPDQFLAKIEGDQLGSVIYDGKKLTVFDESTNSYAQNDLPGTLQDFLKEADRLEIPTPMLDFLVPSYCKESLDESSEIEAQDSLILNGEPVEHYSLRNTKDEIDWEVWVKKEGDRYLIKKVVITSTFIASQPQYEFTLISETLGEEISASEYEFTAPESAVKVDFLANIDDASSVDEGEEK